MSAGWTAGVIAFLCVLVSTPIVRAICRHWSFYDSIGPLKIHDAPIPRLGGVSIALGLIAAIAIEGRAPTRNLALWFAAFGTIWLAGFIDDTQSLAPIFKLTAQIGSAILLYAAGWNLPLHVPALVGAAIISAIVVLFVNAFNFLDGCDGLAAGVTAVIAVAYTLADGDAPGSFSFVVACSLLGAAVGFLNDNFPPAKIFMGDSGSTILGFCVALLGIDFVSRAPPQTGAVKWIFPLIIAAVPLVDGIVVVSRRITRGASALQGDRLHFYDHLLAREWNARGVALATYAVTALLAALGLWMLRGGQNSAIIVSTVCAGGVIPLAGIEVLPWGKSAVPPRHGSENLNFPSRTATRLQRERSVSLGRRRR